MRDENGHWLPGYSGNPTGRPSVPEEIREAVKQHTPKAVQVLAEGMDDPDPRVRIVCAKEMLDRALGRPAIANAEDEKIKSTQQAHLDALVSLTAKARNVIDERCREGDQQSVDCAPTTAVESNPK